MKQCLFVVILVLAGYCGFATTVIVNASSSGYATTTARTTGNMIISNTTNRGYAVWNLASAGIPAAATITSVKVIFTYTVSGSSTPTYKIYGYIGDISSLSASALYNAAVTTNQLYTSGWGTSNTTKTMSSTAAADTFIKRNRSSIVSLTWVESGSTRVYTVTGAPSIKLQIVYTCVTPTSVSITASANPVCSGTALTLTGHATGGITYNWAGPNSFSSTALVPAAFTTGTASAGIYTFTATSACNIGTKANFTLTVKTVPAVTTGSSVVCMGATTTVSNTGIGGVWSSSNNAIATVSASGIVTGVTVGAVNISYTTGCGSAGIFAMTVKSTPAAITGITNVCRGGTLTLSDATAGGTWSSGTASVATINSVTGVVTGVTNGTATITYNNAGCGIATTTVNVLTATAAISPGTATVCTGMNITLTDVTNGGTWTSSSPGIATVSATGLVTGVTAGTATISYYLGCGTPATSVITVNATPAVVGGATSVCIGASSTLSDATTGGTWSTSDAGIASVSATGMVTGIAQGTAIISYTKTGCSALQSFNVKIAPGTITGASSVCTGISTVLANTALFGTWTTSNASIASVNATGSVTGIAAGTATITYSTGCGTNVTKTETISTAPAAITGAATVCTGANITLSDAPSGGTWSSSDNAIASITTSGSVRGRTQGTVTISYAFSGCIATTSILVKTPPAAITGTTAICNGATSVLGNTSASGTWSTSNAAIASIDTSGFVTSVAPGTANITYTTGCGANATATVNIGLAPTALSGATSICTGSNTTITESVGGGSWSSSNTAVATVNNSGVITGISAGSVTISYSLTNGCGANVVSIVISVGQTGTWLGATSTDWNDANNWSCGIPDASINVVIPSGTAFLPDFSSATFSVRDLTIATGVAISLSDDATICVRGNLTNNGIADGDGPILLNGSSAQTVYGKGTISNLTINNASGVSIHSGDTVRIIDNLTLTGGTFTTNSGIRLLSNASGTGRIAPISGGSISGSVTVEQYFQGGQRAYRFFGHPFNSAIPLNMISKSIDITGMGGAANGFTPTGTNAPSCHRYDPMTGNSSLASDPGWRPFTKTTSTIDSNAFKQYQGIRLFVRGAKGEGLSYGDYTPSSVTVSMNGNVNTGNQTITLRKGAHSDYNMVGNPYPSPVDIGTIIASAKAAGQVAGTAFFVWNPFLGTAGAYESIVIGNAYFIGANTSFQVRAANDGATLSFTESNKAVISDAVLLKPAIGLRIYDAANNPWDMTYLSFNDSATNNDDINYDATKNINPDLNFYSISPDKTKFSIDARPYTANTVIPIGLVTSYAQTYTIRVEGMALPAGGTLYLHDKLLNKYVLLEQDTQYSFDVTSDAATQGENRFELTTSIGNNKVLQVTLTPNPATDEVTIAYSTTNTLFATYLTITDVTGARVLTKNLGTDQSGIVTVALDELPAGIYLVEVASGTNKSVQKLVKP